MAHIIKDVFTPEQLVAIREKINLSPRIVDKKHGRYTSSIRTTNDLRADDSPIILPDDIHDRIQKLATDNCSKTAKPSYIKAAKYSGFLNPPPNLPAHLDDNACSYTIDLQLSSNVDWPLYVNGEEFTLRDNWFFRIPHLTSEENELNHENRLIREAPLLVKYGKQDGTENKYVR